MINKKHALCYRQYSVLVSSTTAMLLQSNAATKITNYSYSFKRVKLMNGYNIEQPFNKNITLLAIWQIN